MKNKRKIKFEEWLSVQTIKRPRTVVLLSIVLGNLLFMVLAAIALAIISNPNKEPYGFWQSMFYTIAMILDAGSINYIVNTIADAGSGATFFSLCVVLIGMISFTGCVIGYITNAIAGFIDNVNSGNQKLKLSNHTVILNWNSRGSEIINDLLYSEYKERIVVMVEEGKEDVEEEIRNRLADTINQENRKVLERCKNMPALSKYFYYYKHQFKNDLTVIVREGNTFSEKQLMDISLDKTKSCIILNRDETDNSGNSMIIKTLVLVAEITSKETSRDDQKIIVEVDDEWTFDIIQKIIRQKEKIEKCNIIPVSANRVLGQLLSQFSIMPQLNQVYSILFSNEGAEFYSVDEEKLDYFYRDILNYMDEHNFAIPLTTMETKIGKQYFYMADSSDCYSKKSPVEHGKLDIKVNPDYWLPKRNILILGHNSKMSSLMDGFNAFRSEWNEGNPYGTDILNIGIVGSKSSLEAMDYYKDYPYVNRDYMVETDLYDQKMIYDTIERFIDQEDGDTCILILSDDMVEPANFDASALTYLIYTQDILAKRRAEHGGKDIEQIDVVIEILDPKNYDVARSYSVDDVVISNRYISKMITQIGEKETLFEFYTDILTYDMEDSESYTSKELYTKRCGDYLSAIPQTCRVSDLIQNIYVASQDIDDINETVLLGYIDEENKMYIFSGDQNKNYITLTPDCQLILFSNH